MLLTSASPSLTKIIVRRKDSLIPTVFTSRLPVATVWTYKSKTVCFLHGGHFDVNDFLIKQGVTGHVIQMKMKIS